MDVLRRLSSFVAATALALGALAVVAPAAHASTAESQFTTLANNERAKRGLRSYSVAGDLVTVARRHAARMAASGSIYHNPKLGSEVSGWQAVGENVGMGGSASAIHQAFMNSAPHRANILDGDFTQVGMGTAYDSKGVLYITQVFRKPMGSTTAPPPPAPRKYTPRKPSYTAMRTAPAPVYRPVAPVAAAKPVAKPAKRVDPAVELRKRLAAARRVAARSADRGALGRAVTYVDVMASLAR
ncbi:MAG TPA: CAP domain-containing protein [Frankiaceae bacterium]|nr:CAP domain-containing protein [Frankiaceae bacterium]